MNSLLKKLPSVETFADLPDLAARKRLLLEFLENTKPGKGQSYRRLSLSPIRYAGGKSLAVGHIIKHIPDSVTKIVSPFFGGGSVEIACANLLGLEVHGYDIFNVLTNFWNVELNTPDLLYKELLKFPPEAAPYEAVRKELNKFWKSELEMDSLELAAKYIYNFNLSYGPGFMGWASKIYLDPQKYTRMIERLRDFRAPNLSVSQGDFQQVIPANPDAFLYCDPPYHIGDDSKMFKGIYPMRNIPVHHNGFPHEQLRDLLRAHKGGFILSYNDSPTIREYYEGFEFHFPSWQYTMGQGETRIGTNRIKDGNDHVKESHEILIIKQPEK